MFTSYLDQIERKAAEHGLDLAEACRLEGIAQSTLFRWRQGKNFPREGTARAIIARMETMARERAA